MKKIFLLILFINISLSAIAQQPMTISPGLTVTSPSAGTSGLKFTNLNSSSSAATTPTKVLSVDASGNVILGNASSGGGSTPAINVPTYTTISAAQTAIPSPVSGMLVYVTSLGVYYFYTGSTWAIVNHFGLDMTNNRLTTTGYTGGIDAQQFVSNGTSNFNKSLLHFKGASTSFLRFDMPTNTFSIVQETTPAPFQNTSGIVWKHYDFTNATTPVTTNMFGFNNGIFTINGFTKLGDEPTTTTSGVTSSSPAVKYKLLTGTLNGSSVTPTSSFAHGLNWTKIIAVSVIVEGRQGTTSTVLQYSSPTYEGSQNTTSSAYGFSHYFDATNIYVERVAGTTAPASALLSRPVRILITYMQ
ncbi:hypothetical protein LV89_02596 [Arcicella aurantiaca]|uniref:Uncharacterized protein n=1 Tax=Arcicella aurantiaca TaxID=591202 RepID=A0A316E8V9_9BACT|nr:hypothetical protein [Arcicella aurantiaca]PWK26425.1 hypothetical protein LV89_02596 [Arcicella aurantiaca]